MNVSLFGRYVNAGLSGSIPRGVTTYFQSAERTSTQVHSPSSAAGYFARVFLKTNISAWHFLKLNPMLQTKCCAGAPTGPAFATVCDWKTSKTCAAICKPALSFTEHLRRCPQNSSILRPTSMRSALHRAHIFLAAQFVETTQF